MKQYSKIGLGGGCHWCTEAVFQSLKGIQKVEQGFIASTGKNASFSEGVLVYYHENGITLKDLISIHLHTHNCTAEHSMRKKYRSAVYFFSSKDNRITTETLKELQVDFKKPIITKLLSFRAFKPSHEMFHDYYLSNKKKPFCKVYIEPKIKTLKNRFAELMHHKEQA